MSATRILYRAYAHTGTLLYVGKTADPGVRLRKHAEGKDWWAEVATIQLNHYRSQDALDRAERRAIATELPVYNVQYNPDRGKAAEVYRQAMVLREEMYGEEELHLDEMHDGLDECACDCSLEQYVDDGKFDLTPAEREEARQVAERLWADYLDPARVAS